MSAMPAWDIPDNLQELLDSDEGGMWEDHRWAPILLTAMKGTSYGGRDIPLAWQIEFQPDDEACEAANRKIQDLGVEADGYGWADVLNSVITEHHPEIAGELHFGDTDTDTCVVWVESEDTCKLLIRAAWSLIYGSTKKSRGDKKRGHGRRDSSKS
jgi:hypothetical protein